MTPEDLFIDFLTASNETLTAAIIIVAASMLLYNLTRNWRDRVARTSAIVLACVTITYIGDVFISLGPGPGTYAATLRFQWVGIAFIPAALFHLSDALLATTGLPSRGRRRRIVRLLYLLSSAFLVAATFTDILIYPVPQGRRFSVQGGYLFWVYVLYFGLATVIALINVQRARQRCLVRSTRRRMGYLQFAILTPPLGIFPYSVLLGIGDDFSLWSLVLVNLGNLIVILMLFFLAYPLSFFGSRIPDRVVKAELLRFMLRGPATGMLALAVIIYMTPATRILSLPGTSFLPFAVVAVVLLWQWIVALILPWLEKKLIYFDEDDDQLSKLQTLSDRLLTRADLLQLVEAILEAACDYLQVRTSFVASFIENGPELIKVVGRNGLTNEMLGDGSLSALNQAAAASSDERHLPGYRWHEYRVLPMHSNRLFADDGNPLLIGFMGIEWPAERGSLTADETSTLQVLVGRATRTLDDMLLQREIYAALEGLLPQYSTTRSRAAEVEYRKGYQAITASSLPDREQVQEQVRAALRHYWGGSGLTGSRLQELHIVRQQMPDNDNNSVKALRVVLLRAIEQLRPAGQQKMTSPEWTLYNILQLRFIEKVKVRDVAIRLALSEPDLYRKQRVAIEALADVLLELEQAALNAQTENPPQLTADSS